MGQALVRTEVQPGVYFDLPPNYNDLSVLGRGSYGVVAAARIVGGDPSRAMVALKKFADPLCHIIFAKRTLREMKFLRNLKHENIIEVRDMFISGTSREDFRDLYVVTDVLDTDLSYIVKSGQTAQGSTTRFFLYQILRGMKYVHSAGLIHRDLKPKNILVNRTCDLKICDFGLARLAQDALPKRQGLMTEYVCTRWYRAPEVLCCWDKYSYPIDMWSIGCVFAELLLLKAVFRGVTTIDQLDKIRQVIGSPSREEIMNVPNERARQYLLSQSRVDGCWREKFGDRPQEVQSLLRSLLQFDPSKRPTCTQALEHEFLAALHDEEDEPTRDLIDCSGFEFEHRSIDTNVLREELFRETLQYHPDALAAYRATPEWAQYDIRNWRELASDEEQYVSDEDEREQNDPPQPSRRQNL